MNSLSSLKLLSQLWSRGVRGWLVSKYPILLVGLPQYLEVVHLLMTLRLWKLCFPLRSYGTQVESDILRGISLRRTLRSFGAVWMKSAQDLSPDQRIERGLL